MRYDKPLPKITPLERPFWDFAQRGILAIQVCDSCGHSHLPAVPMCPECLGVTQTWTPASGEGVLESWVDFHHAYWEAFKSSLPYRVCLVRLAEGPLFISNLVGSPDAVRHRAPVRVTFEKVTEEVTLPMFALA